MNIPSSMPRLLWLGLCLCCLPLVAAEPAFHFEGGLVEGGVPANGTYDLTFELFNANTGGTSAGIHTNATVEVIGGVYEVLLPFAPALLDFNHQWIEVAARESGSEDERLVLTPRLLLSAVPYASKAALADGVVPGAIGALELQAGAVTSEAIQSGAVTLEKLNLNGAGEGQSIVRRGSAVNWESLNFWSLLGNAGTIAGEHFLGTTDEQPLEFRVNNQQGLLLIPTAAGANIIAGAANNQIAPGLVAATIGGGGFHTVDGNGGTISGGFGNSVGGQAGVVGGGQGNTASGVRAVVAGGAGNQAGGQSAVVAGGSANTASGINSAIVGGGEQLASGPSSFVGGGLSQRATGSFATVTGGQANQATGDYGFVGGGSWNLAEAAHATVGGGRSNLVRGDYSLVAGGDRNISTRGYSTVGGGRENLADGFDAVVAGGRENQAVGLASVVAGGWLNEAAGSYASVPGGVNNQANGFASFAAGQSALAGHNGAFVWADSSSGEFASTANDQFLIRAAGGVGIGTDAPQAALDVNGTLRAQGLQMPAGAAAGRVLLSDADGVGSWQPQAVRLQPSPGNPNLIGGANNVISNQAVGTTISGGFSNRASHDYATIAGGRDNRAYGTGSTVSGGRNNRVDGQSGTIAGGQQNVAVDFGSTIAGGQQNTAGGFISTIAGGLGNTAGGQLSAIGGGMGNSTAGDRAFVGGGSINRAVGDYGVAAGGNRNWATGDYSVVGGGDNNIAGADHSTVGGGLFNSAAGPYSSVPGGISNFALGEASQAAGQFAVAAHDGTFVWADGSSFGQFSSTAENQYLIRAAGGVGIGLDNPTAALDVNGTIRSRTGGIEFPDGSVQETSAFNGWSFADGVFQVAPAQSFVISLGDQNALRLEPNSVAANFIAGSAENSVGNGVVAATVGGGWRNTVNASSGTVAGGQGNRAEGVASTVGGGAGNQASGTRSVISGGNENIATGNFAAVGGGQLNSVTADGVGGFIGGGYGNSISGGDAVVAGGRRNLASGLGAFGGGGLSNQASGEFSVVAGGLANRAAGRHSVVSGGEDNLAVGRESTVSGGWLNEAAGQYSTVPGGVFNTALGFASLAAGQLAQANHNGSFVWADISSGELATTGPNQFLIRAAGGVGVGVNDPQAALDVAGTIRTRTGGVQFPDGSLQTTAVRMDGWAVSNGVFQVAGSASFAVALENQVGLRLEPNAVAANFIAGSPENVVSPGSVGATIGGGWFNAVNASMGSVGGGQGNSADAPASTVGGGAGNRAAGNRAVIAGGNENVAAGNGSAIVGGQFNTITNSGSSGFVGGGYGNLVSAGDAALVGGRQNTASGVSGFVGGGLSNVASGEFSVVSGGRLNWARGADSSVQGGLQNRAMERHSNVAGGEENTASGRQSAVGGGWRNEAQGQYATVPGGVLNAASGVASLAAGQSAKALHNGTFVWADVNGGEFASTAANQFLIRADGGVGIGTASPQAALDVVGEVRSTIFTPTSDRNAKENFAPVDPREVLAKVAALPISRWNFKTLPGAEHFGPMAQDFHAAFGLNGGDDRHIATVDADGVALAAIQGLNQKLDEKSAEVETLKQQNSALLRRLEALEQKLK